MAPIDFIFSLACSRLQHESIHGYGTCWRRVGGTVCNGISLWIWCATALLPGVQEFVGPALSARHYGYDDSRVLRCGNDVARAMRYHCGCGAHPRCGVEGLARMGAGVMPLWMRLASVR